MYEYRCEYCEGTVRSRLVNREAFKHKSGFCNPGEYLDWRLRFVWQSVLFSRYPACGSWISYWKKGCRSKRGNSCRVCILNGSRMLIWEVYPWMGAGGRRVESSRPDHIKQRGYKPKMVAYANPYWSVVVSVDERGMRKRTHCRWLWELNSITFL